ncbi:MAG TPA: UDP-N-acetylglucosamine 1-carboxyvinyltransferase [Methylomirabilota bacterium]|jgi:UDP-N-acetylglucosamine 1-carboxyvinyltransferase|nr:UDP-N-acetylglucosamine 1-carboxyvinyltransferase [Methylomirabilota bacterium]
MPSYRIEGGAPLRGAIRASGAKNAATKQIVAALLTDDEVVLDNVPRIGDVAVTVDMCRALGAEVDVQGETIRAGAATLKSGEVPVAFSGVNRIPVLMVGPLLHRYGRASVPLLGGDAIGARPIDYHMEALRRLGASVTLEGGVWRAEAKRLHGALIDLPYPSVGATESVLLSSVLAEGTTVIKNAAVEPEILDLILLLQKMGALITVEVDRSIVVEGVTRLRGARHRIIGDRIEVASFAAAAVATDGDVLIEDAEQSTLMTFLNALRRVGGEFEVMPNGVRFFRGGELRSTTLETDVHPGFATDWQQPFVVLLTQARGLSVVHETVHERRFGYTAELRAMGATIEVYTACLGGRPCRYRYGDHPHSCLIQGPTSLRGTSMRIPDLRAGFSYLLAACVASGVSMIDGAHYVERGYADIPAKITQLGGRIRVE